jgi:penicillin-binding protein 1C
VLATLHNAGFETLEHSAEYYGLGLALGNGDVTLLELANAYRALANGGTWRPVQWLATEPEAMVAEAVERRMMSRQAATLVLDILSDPVARVPSFGVETPLDFPFKAAAKTGTSRHFTDNWAVATTGGFTVAVWVGNFSGHPMQGVGASPGRPVAASRRAARGAALPTGRPADAVAGRRQPGACVPAVRPPCRTRLSADDRVVHSRHRAGA